YLGLQNYFQLEGLSYRIVPIPAKDADAQQQGYVSTDLMYRNVMEKFKWGGIERKEQVNYTVQAGETIFDVCDKFDMLPNQLRTLNNFEGELTAGTALKVEKPVFMYLDENIQRMTMNLRSNFTRLSEALLREGKVDSAVA